MADEPDQSTIVFVVDDESVVRDAISAVVELMGFSVECFSSASEFIEFIESYDVSGPVCLIADIQMPEVSGIELLRHLSALGEKLPIILMTGAGGTAIQDEARALGAAAFLEKPFRSAQLREVITTVLQPGGGQTIKP